MERLIKAFVIACCGVLALGLITYDYPDGALSLVVVTLLAAPTIILIKHYAEDEAGFLILVFLAALFLRIGLGLVIDIYELRLTFGGDAGSYHEVGKRLMELWFNLEFEQNYLTQKAQNLSASGWGMYYLTAILYSVFGASILVAQSFCGTIGAITIPMVYMCSWKIFNNKMVSRVSALGIALLPSFVIWSSQLLKDGLITFLLVCVMILVLQLQKKLSYLSIALLVLSIFGIMSLRFYIFYMVAIAVAGSFLIGFSGSPQQIIRNGVIIVLLGLALTYLGVIKNASDNFETYGDLERVQKTRFALAETADSGFGQEIDVSTPVGAISAIPIGFAYLMFAPFPWEVTKLHQALVLPEVLIWWLLTPLLLSGLAYSMKHKLKPSVPIVLFSVVLILAYCIFQGNVGMVYRQRTQIQIFLFMFMATGWTLMQERMEYKRKRRRFEDGQLKKNFRTHKSPI